MKQLTLCTTVFFYRNCSYQYAQFGKGGVGFDAEADQGRIEKQKDI